MSSPFPGMDPYLESPEWFQGSLLVSMAEHMIFRLGSFDDCISQADGRQSWRDRNSGFSVGP